MSSRRERLLAMLAKTPDDLFLMFALAMEELSVGDEAAALAQFQRVLERDPAYHVAHFQLAQLYHRNGAEAQAIPHLQAGIAAARAKGETKAVNEMQQFLDMLE